MERQLLGRYKLVTAAGADTQLRSCSSAALVYMHWLQARSNMSGFSAGRAKDADACALGCKSLLCMRTLNHASSLTRPAHPPALPACSTTAVNALYAWRAGFMAMASPTAIFIAHMIGIAASCLLTPAAWMLFDQSAGPAGVMGSVSSSSLLAADGFFASPMAAIFRQTAVLATAGVSALPAHALWVAFSALIVGVALNALRDTLPMQLRGVVPIPAAVGVVFMSGASIAVDLAVGAAARIFWRLRYPRSADAYALVVGCALIAGEGLWGLGKGLLAAFGVQAPICMTFSVPPRV